MKTQAVGSYNMAFRGELSSRLSGDLKIYEGPLNDYFRANYSNFIKEDIAIYSAMDKVGGKMSKGVKVLTIINGQHITSFLENSKIKALQDLLSLVDNNAAKVAKKLERVI